MRHTDDLLANNQRFAERLTARAKREAAPRVAVVACMDARMDVYAILGLKLGEAHVIRNAGGVVSDDALRSLVASQHLLGTREVMVIQHTDCGMTKFDAAGAASQIEQVSGAPLPFELGAIADVRSSVAASIERLQTSPFLPHKDDIRGFIYDVESGLLHEV